MAPARSWTDAERRDAAIDAPTGGGLLRADTRVIERPGWYQIVTPSTGSAYLNEVAHSHLDASEADAIIDETIATYRELGLPVKWCVGPWTEPADTGERLASRGFEGWDVRGMAIASDARRAEPRDGVRIEEVDETTLDAFLRTATAGWGLPPEQLDAERTTHREALRERPRRAHLFAATVGEEVAATAGMLLRDGYGYLVGAQVLERFRGRGLYRALIDARLAWLRERGIGLAVTQAREATSAPILERLGWETVFESRCWLLSE